MAQEQHVLPNDNYLKKFVPDYYNMLYNPDSMEKNKDPEQKIMINPKRFNHNHFNHYTNDQYQQLREIQNHRKL